MTALDTEPSTPGPAEARGAAPRPLPAKVSPRTFTPDDLRILLGALASSVSLAWVICYRIGPVTGFAGFLIVTFLLFVAIQFAVVRQLKGPVAARDRLAATLVTAAGLCLIIPLTTIMVYVVVKGIKGLYPGFFFGTLATVGPDSGLRVGGAAHAIVGTLMQVGVAVIISVPLGVATAVFLNEVRGPLARPVRLIVDAMSGVPSIVAGLFIFNFFVLSTGFSGFAAGLALAVLMLPSVTRATEEVLRLVPGGLREASLALGGTEWQGVRRVVLPTARIGIVTAVILGMARAVGETAPLIMTSFGSFLMNWNVFQDPQASLPLFVLRLIGSPEQTQVDRAWTGALVLVALVLTLFIIARVLGNRRVKRPGR